MSGAEADVDHEPDDDDVEIDDEVDDEDEAPGRRGVAPIVASVAVLLVVAGLVVLLATRKPAADRLTDSPLLGHPTPTFSAATLDGDTFTLDAAPGKVVFVNFLASWCGPCKLEHPALDAFSRRHERLGDAEVVSVMYEDDEASIRAFFAERGGSWPVVVGDTSSISLDFGVLAVPETFVVAADGTVVARFAGQVTEEGLESVLAEARALG